MQDAIIELLGQPNFGQLATVNADGSPHVDTVWLIRDDETILVATTMLTRKAINLRANPAAHMVVTQRDDPYVQAQFRLRCAGIVPDDDLAICDRISHKYIGRPFPQRHHQERVVLQLRIVGARFHRARV